MAVAPIFEGTVKNGQVQILPADTTTYKTIYTAGANGSNIYHINVNSTDTSARDLLFAVTISGTDYPLCTISCPANSGNTNSISILTILDNTRFGTQLVDSNGNKCMYLASGSILKVKSLTTLTAAKVISFFVQAGDF